jgi:hypothetical protein
VLGKFGVDLDAARGQVVRLLGESQPIVGPVLAGHWYLPSAMPGLVRRISRRLWETFSGCSRT